MNIPKIKLHIYKNDANEKPIKKIGNITVAHIEDMQKNISQEKDVTNIIECLEKNVLNFENIR